MGFEVFRRTEADEDLRCRNVRLDLLAQGAKQLLSTDAPEHIVQAFCERVMGHLECQVFAGFVSVPDQLALRLIAHAGMDEHGLLSIGCLFPGGVAQECHHRPGCQRASSCGSGNPDTDSNPLVSYGIQAYACHPLIDQGRNIGILSFGTRNRTRFSDEDLDLMRAVADLVAAAMARKLERKNLEASGERLNLALAGAGAGCYEWNLVNGKSIWSAEIWPLYGLAHREVPPSYEAWRQTVNPGDLARVEETIGSAVAREAEFEVEWQVNVPAGSPPRWLLSRARPIHGPDGSVERYIGIAIDISQRRQMEQTLRETKRRLILAQQVAKIGVFEWNIQTGSNFWTPELEAIYGLAPGEFGKTRPSWEQLVHPEDRAGALTKVEEAMATGEPVEHEWRIVWPDGSVHWVAGRFQCFKDADGRPLRVSGVNIDITERKQAEEELRWNKECLSLAIEGSSGAQWEIKLDPARPGLLIDAMNLSAHHKKIIGYTDHEFPNSVSAWQARIHPDDRTAVAASAQAHTEGRTPSHNVTYRIQHRDGSWRWIASSGRLFHNAAGRPLRWAGVDWDITEHKRAEQALRESKRRLALALEASGSVVWEFDVLTGQVRGNDELWSMLGYTPDELRTVDEWMTQVHETDFSRVRETLDDTVRGGSDTFCLEMRIRCRDGNWRWILCQGTPAERDADGRAVLLVGTHTDIHEHKLVAMKVEQLNAELEHRVAERTAELVAANRELEGFTFAASHDLRGPLGRINSFSELLEMRYRDHLAGDGLLFLDFIKQNASRLTQLVEDLLSHARIVQQPLEFQKVDILAAAQAVLGEKADDILSHGTTVHMDVPYGEVLADAYALRQVLANLLENALKYSSLVTAPRVEIGGEILGERFRLWVKDNGIGFDMAYHDKIFEIFRRLHTHEEYSGSGIGLALVKRAMKRMDGQVWAESNPGEGATFFLELQVAAGTIPA